MSEKSNIKTALALVTLGLSPLFIWLRAWVFLKLWVWFVVPLGAPLIGIWHGAGLVMCATMWKSFSRTRDDPDDPDGIKDFSHDLSAGTLVPLLVLAFGAIFHSMMTP